MLLEEVYDSVTVFPSTLDFASVASATGAKIRFFSEDAGAVAPAGITVSSTLPTVVLTGAVNAAASVFAVLEAGAAAFASVAGAAAVASAAGVAGMAFASVAGVVLEPVVVALASGVALVAGVVLASGVAVVAGVVLASVVAAVLGSVGAAVLESAAGVVVAGVVALASAGVDPAVLESVADVLEAGVVVSSTGAVLAVVLVVLASLLEPATIDVPLEPDFITVAFVLAKSTCDPSFTVLSLPTSSPVEAKNLFNVIALRSGVIMKILPLFGLPITRYTKFSTPEAVATFARKYRALPAFSGVSIPCKLPPLLPISRLAVA
jgi:hypothetical protein